MSVPSALAGEVWDCRLGPAEGHEQAGRRPCLVVSVDELGAGASELAIVVPITRTWRTALDVEITPSEAGITSRSYAQPYQVRAVSRGRLVRRRGAVAAGTLGTVIHRVHLLTRAP